MKAIFFWLSSLGLLGSVHFDKNNPRKWCNQVTVLSTRLELLASKLDKSSTEVLESCRVAMMTLLERFEKYKTKLEAAEAKLEKAECQNRHLERISDIGAVAVDFETVEELAGEEQALIWFNGFAEEYIKKK